MKYLIFFLVFLACAGFASAGCCVINEDYCSFWDFNSWSGQENFCNSLTGFGLASEWNNVECSSITKPGDCCDGWTGNCNFALPIFTGRGGCKERWECTEWSGCEDDIMRRSCKDLNKCGKDSPKEIMHCGDDEAVLFVNGEKAGVNEDVALAEQVIGAEEVVRRNNVSSNEDFPIVIALLFGVFFLIIMISVGVFVYLRRPSSKKVY